jgi:hypothetical protein
MSMWFLHPEYSGSNSLKNDLFLAKTAKPFAFNDFVRPACLPQPAEILEPNTMCFITGFGYMGADDTWDSVEKLAEILQEGMVPIRTNHDCMTKYGTQFTSYNNICIGGRGIIARDGDSGGPLTCLHKYNGKVVQVLHGVSSYSALKEGDNLEFSFL